jgi:hypothetical protein
MFSQLRKWAKQLWMRTGGVQKVIFMASWRNIPANHLECLRL